MVLQIIPRPLRALNLQQKQRRCPHPADYEVVKLEFKNLDDFRKNSSPYGPRRLVTIIVIIISMGHDEWSYWFFLYHITGEATISGHFNSRHQNFGPIFGPKFCVQNQSPSAYIIGGQNKSDVKISPQIDVGGLCVEN